MTSDDHADLRVSDADRNRAADELRDHAGDGRLDTDELEARLSRVFSARTVGDLAALTRDLPATPRQLARSEKDRRAELIRRSIQETGGSFGVFVVGAVIWAATGADSFFWPIFVLIPFILSACRSGWDLLGPGADPDAAEARLEESRQQRHATRRDRRH